MDHLKYFLEAASRRQAEKEQTGRWTPGKQLENNEQTLVDWWKEILRKRMENGRNMGGMDRMMEERIFGRNGGKLYDSVNGPETGNLTYR